MTELTNNFTSRRGRPPKYPWTASDAEVLGMEEYWSDGGTRTLYRSTSAPPRTPRSRLFEADLISFRTMVHRKARDLGPDIGAYTHINKANQSIKVRFYVRNEAVT